MTETVKSGKSSTQKDVGATVVFRAVPGMTAEWLQRVVDCHLARAAAVGQAYRGIKKAVIDATDLTYHGAKGATAFLAREASHARNHANWASCLTEITAAALTSSGFSRIEHAIRVGWERRFARAVVLRSPDGGELDLHVSLAGGYYGVRLDHGQLWARPSQTFVLAGTTMHALNADDRLLHACLHSELGKFSGERSLRDVERLVLGGQATWRTTVDNVGGTGIGIVVAAAIHRAWESFELDPHPASKWADALLADPSVAGDLAALRRVAPADDDGWIVEARGTFSALRWPDRVAFAAGIVAPSQANLRDRGRTRVGHFVGLVRTLADQRQ